MPDDTLPTRLRPDVDPAPSTVPPGSSDSPTPLPAVVSPPADRPTGPPGYELHDEIGRGGMGVVYRARDLALDRDVAVKLLLDRYPAGSIAARRFEEEARITGQLQHPGIPAVHQVGALPDGRPFLAMKLIRGRTLAELLAGGGRPPNLLAVFEQVCQAVGYAHSRGVVHRDLKPANVMVGAFGEVQVMDWGLAKVLGGGAAPQGGAADPDATLDAEIRPARGANPETQPGSILGTPAFMAPEQATGDVDRIDARSDVFGLGAVLCAILTGRPPYVSDTAESTLWLAAGAALDDARERLAGCGADPDLVALCNRCLSADPAGRPADGGEVAAAVAALRAAADDRARRAEAAAIAERSRRRVVLAAAGAVAAVLAAGAGVSAWQAVRASNEAENARAAEGKAKDSEAKAVEREHKEKTARETAEAVATFMREVFAQTSAHGQASPTRKVNQQITVKEAMDYAAKQIEGRFPGRPEIEAAVRAAIGNTYRELGAYADATAQMRMALALREAALGPDHPDTLRNVNNLANISFTAGDFAAAEPLYKRALAGFEKALGPDHPDTLSSADNLAQVYQVAGDYAAAEPLLKRALAGSEKALSPDHPDTIASANNLASLYYLTKRYAAAEPLFVRALAGTEKHLGPDHPDTAASANNLAQLYTATGNFGAAEPLLKRALAGWEKSLGRLHPDTLLAIANLALLYHRTGDYAAAEPLYKRALAGQEKALGPDHPHTLNCVYNLAGLYQEMKDYAAAEPLYKQALAGREKALGPDHPDTLHTVYYLADLYAATRRYDEAIPLYERVIPGYGRHPELTQSVASVRSDLGLTLLAIGRPTPAVQHLLAGYDGLTKYKTLSPRNRNRLRRVTQGLVEVYEATNQPAKAAEWRAKLAALPPEVAPRPRPAR